MNLEGLPTHSALLKRNSYLIMDTIRTHGKDTALLISADKLSKHLKLTEKQPLIDALNEARRRGLISYRLENEALLITLAIGRNAYDQFAEETNVLQSQTSRA